MFYYIKGSVAHTEPNVVVIDAGGVGYLINTSYTSSGGVKTGDSATFYTHLIVREDVFDIYGFLRPEELTCFRQLISVSGVGPKAAVSILGAVTPDKLALCVITGDEKALTAASGVGKKLAQRVILELKDKMAKSGLEQAYQAGGDEASSSRGGEVEDAVAALAVLGYPRAMVLSALKGADLSGLKTDEIVRMALKNLF